MPRVLPPPIIIPPRSKCPSYSPDSSPGMIPETPSNKTYWIENNRICTIRNDMQVCLLLVYHLRYSNPDCLYATIKDVRDKNKVPHLMRFSLIWGTNVWNPVQCCSLNELSSIIADIS